MLWRALSSAQKPARELRVEHSAETADATTIPRDPVMRRQLRRARICAAKSSGRRVIPADRLRPSVQIRRTGAATYAFGTRTCTGVARNEYGRGDVPKCRF